MGDADDQVVLLDDGARPTGTMPKLAAHRAPGYAHLAFSVLLEDDAGRVLLQRRASEKYHFADTWANSCCSHPRPGESVTRGAVRRIQEELGVIAEGLWASSAFWYRASDPRSGLVEVEYDVVLHGHLREPDRLDPDPTEVADLRWLAPDVALEQLASERAAVAPWLPSVLRVVAGRRPGARPAPTSGRSGSDDG